MTVAFCSLMSRAASVMNCSGFCLNFANVSGLIPVEDRCGGAPGELGLLGDLAEQVVLHRGRQRTRSRCSSWSSRDLEARARLPGRSASRPTTCLPAWTTYCMAVTLR